MSDKIIGNYGLRVGYSPNELKQFHQKGHRIRHVQQLSKATSLYSIEVRVIKSRHCNSNHNVGQTFVMDVDGNFITKLCPKKMCVYLMSQLTIPVALINERLSEGVDPNSFHFMRVIRCPDVGVECLGYGEVMVEINVVKRNKT